MTELLAPAGNFESLKAAVESGADAVYLAGDNFGARAFAGNFSQEELRRAVEYAHLRNVQIHVTVNTIIEDGELENFSRYIKFLADLNVDAFLVQDLGAAKIAREIAPQIPLHASTQMTVHNSEGVAALAELGFSRAVLAREVTLPEIETIVKNSEIEIEIFMHGALCVCFSGQCLMSSMIGARSGNRGKCAQPCRLPYDLIDENGREVLKDAGKYLLSPKDLNTLEILPEILKTGVASLKIEGRMKRPEYVATVVGVYRRAIDKILAGEKNYTSPEENLKLAQIFNRDFTTAYLKKNPGKNLISDKKPNNRGVLIGRVAKVERGKISVKLAGKLNAGDQCEIWVKVGGRVTFTVNDFKISGDVCTLEIPDTRGVKIHDRIFKIFDSELTAAARKFFTSAAPIKKFPVNATVTAKIGKPLILTLTDDEGNSATAETNFLAEPAKTRPLTFETLLKQVGRTGNSIFELKNLSADIEENLMVPLGEINEVRRKVTEELERLRLKKFVKVKPEKISTPEKFSPYTPERTEIIAQADTIDKIKIAIESGADAILFGGENFENRPVGQEEILTACELVKNAGKNFYLGTPRIVRENEMPELEKILTAAKFDAVYVHNIATLHLAKKIPGVKIHTDFSPIVFNSETINFLKSQGVESVTLSPELTLAQVKNLAKKSSLPVECIVHGKTELMISAYCIPGSFIGGLAEKKCPHVCRKNKFYLRDRKNALFPVVTDQFCRMHILNSKTLSMIENRSEFENVAAIRIDCRALKNFEVGEIIRAYKFGGSEIGNFTRGHYFRGVTGDLER